MKNKKLSEIYLKTYDRLDFPERLKKLVSLAKKADPQYKVFASWRYKYTFNECTSLEKVQEFEKKHNIKIPETFIRYLTEVGNGGAGVGYGVYPLEKLKISVSESEKTIFDYENYEELWASVCNETENAETENNSVWLDELYLLSMNGLLNIGTAGCTMDYCLICKGKNYGKIAFFDCDYIPECPPKIIAASFEEWIETYFRNIILNSD